jgi:ADP-ribose pyrophosphatase
MQRKPIYKGSVVDLGIESIELPNHHTVDLEIVRHPGGAGALVFDEKGNTCLIRQFRHAAGGWLWEIPAGKLDPGETPLSTAKRELEEEVGLSATDWTNLGRILCTPGFCDEVIHLYLARQLNHVPQKVGQHEVIEVHWMPFEQAKSWAQEGKIQDAKTLIAIFRGAEIIEQTQNT